MRERELGLGIARGHCREKKYGKIWIWIKIEQVMGVVKQDDSPEFFRGVNGGGPQLPSPL